MFSTGGFIGTLIRAFGFFVALVLLLVLIGGLVLSPKGGATLSAPMVLFIFAGAYLSFAAGWGLAYGKYLSYPDRRDLLVIGAAVSPLIFLLGIVAVILWWPQSIIPAEQNIPLGIAIMQFVMIYMGLAMSAALQIFGIAIALRYFIKMRIPF